MALTFTVDLSGKVAVVTGGGGVLCGRMAEELAECGAAVAVADLRSENANAVAVRIRKKGGTAIGVRCNVLDRKSLEKARRIILRDLGPVDILINGAGGNHPQATTAAEYMEPRAVKGKSVGNTFHDLDPRSIGFVFDLNFLGTLLPSQVFTRDMAARGSGVVINISSMNAFRPLTKIPAYSAAKAAVSNFTQWLAVHMSRSGVRVNAIAPGFFLTDQNRSLLTKQDGSLTKRAKTILAHSPLGRFGIPADLAGVTLWLASDDASGFVTGAVIPVDGGFSAFSGV